MYYYSLTRTLDTGPGDGYSTTVSISDRDAVNCAHMVANGFNTMSRNFTLGWVLGVVNPETGEVQYDGKIEQINRPEPEPKATDEWPMNQYFTKTFTFKPSSGDADTILKLFGNGETPTFTAFGKMTPETEDSHAPKPDTNPKPRYEHIARSVLAEAYGELQAVKEALADAGVETIPADEGVRDVIAAKRIRDQHITRRDVENAAARAEMIKYVKDAYAKLGRLDAAGERDDLQARFRGMLDVLAKFLVATGEADADEGHAVARRLCGIEDE